VPGSECCAVLGWLGRQNLMLVCVAVLTNGRCDQKIKRRRVCDSSSEASDGWASKLLISAAATNEQVARFPSH